MNKKTFKEVWDSAWAAAEFFHSDYGTTLSAPDGGRDAAFERWFKAHQEEEI